MVGCAADVCGCVVYRVGIGGGAWRDYVVHWCIGVAICCCVGWFFGFGVAGGGVGVFGGNAGAICCGGGLV